MKKVAQMEREFKELERRISRLKELEQELNSLNTEGFESEAKKIKSKLKDPKKVEEIEKAIATLKGKAKELKEKAKPEMEVDLSKKAFPVGVWERLLLSIFNKGNASAKDIEIEFERAEVEGLEIIKSLDVGEKRDLNIHLKSNDIGSVPLKIGIRFEDFDGKRYEESKTVYINVGEIQEKEYETPVEKKIEIKRGYEVLQNNDLRFGIRVINNTDYMIVDVQTMLDYPKTLFSMNDNEIQTLSNIPPNGERTAKYILKPLGCIHNEKIDATIFYKDHTGEKYTVQMQPKEVHCVCPFLKEKVMREGEFAELATACEYIQDGLSFSGIGIKEIAGVVKESCAHRLYVVSEHEIDTKKIVNLAGESIGEKAYYLLTAVIQQHENFTQVALRAYSDKPYGLHGFLNEIGNSIRHLVGSVQSAKEIGVIESKQVINIIDSVVQRTSFGEVGAASVNVEGSVVQRAEIGSVGICSNCGKEVQADAKFCPYCGAELG